MEPFTKDRFTRGLLAGSIAGIIGLTWNLFSYYVLHFVRLRWGDFAAAIIIRRTVGSLWELVLAEIVTVIFSALLGIIFCYLVPSINSKHIWVKGIVYGLILWFGIYALTAMFRIPGLLHIDLLTAAGHFVSAFVWGTSIAFLLYWMDNRLKQKL